MKIEKSNKRMRNIQFVLTSSLDSDPNGFCTNNAGYLFELHRYTAVDHLESK